jgi:hypothetical protein
MEATDGEVRLVGVTRKPYVDPRLQKLRLKETRPVARLMHRVARDYPQDEPLFRAAFGLVVIADHLNAIIAGIGDYEPPLGGLGETMDWSGLPVSAARAKRATLCIHAGLALAQLEAGERDACLSICEQTGAALGRGGG